MPNAELNTSHYLTTRFLYDLKRRGREGSVEAFIERHLPEAVQARQARGESAIIFADEEEWKIFRRTCCQTRREFLGALAQIAGMGAVAPTIRYGIVKQRDANNNADPDRVRAITILTSLTVAAELGGSFSGLLLSRSVKEEREKQIHAPQPAKAGGKITPEAAAFINSIDPILAEMGRKILAEEERNEKISYAR